MSNASAPTTLYDVIGLGFGPANIAISGAILDKYSPPATSGGPNGQCAKNILFIEKHPVFKWHPGMLLPGTRMQISFLKDLATLRSPQSPLTFLSYLHSQNRLLPFINRGTFAPSRKEYADYLSWAAQYVQDHGINVRFSEEVIGIKEAANGTVEVISRKVDSGETFSRFAKNLIISPGGVGKLPSVLSVLSPHPRILHSSVYATSIEPILSAALSPSAPDRPLRIAVVGAGQSSSEVLLDLYSRLSNPLATNGRPVELDMIYRKGALKPSDDSPFANEIFDPASTDMMYNLPSQHARKEILREYRNTNYSVVNPRTIDNLYELIYDQRVEDSMAEHRAGSNDRVRVNMKPHTAILSAEDSGSDDLPSIRLTLQHVLNHALAEQTYDAVICGTGYERNGWTNLLSSSDIGKHFGLHASSSPVELLAASEKSVKAPYSPVSDAPKPRNHWPSTHSSEASTPITSPSPSPSLTNSRLLPSTKLYITRNYRLVPADVAEGEKPFAPKVYLQGCAESTHGLSESLLSILGVRSGLVVNDIFEGASA
ncbi:unnamed protein product [Somion occarium]|uniref:L-ornithine N(5)-monooxygenase [NAD(P)H] n=1 Tax=Somion occarium TaxID=3059160 RepID=A0ABP1DC42_9APHY